MQSSMLITRLVLLFMHAVLGARYTLTRRKEEAHTEQQDLSVLAPEECTIKIIIQ